MCSQDTAKATAPSSLSIPPELRLQIYGHLLAPKDYSQQVQGASPDSRLHSARDFRPASAILRTCQQIYLEAMPVLYGKNTILYSCNVSIFNPYDSSKVGFPDQYIKQIKHLHLKAQPKYGAEGGVPIDVGAAVQHFADRGCEVETFELSLKRDGRYGDQDNYTASEDAAQWLSVHSRELLTALVGLTVSKSLTISLSFSQKGVVNLTAVSGLFRDRLIKRLASHKEFTFTEEEDFDAEFLGDRRKSDKELSDKEVSEDCEDGGDGEEDGSEHTAYESEYFNEDDEDSYLIWYWSKWCLRPQHSKAQKDSASA